MALSVFFCHIVCKGSQGYIAEQPETYIEPWE